jgi:hypothetical protein
MASIPATASMLPTRETPAPAAQIAMPARTVLPALRSPQAQAANQTESSDDEARHHDAMAKCKQRGREHDRPRPQHNRPRSEEQGMVAGEQSESL